ncbi:hypothetical protein M408DRAFT_317021, partial [Serendipita vermifera MAFF 305830]
MESKTKLKLASFDGGGIRGLSQLEVMSHIMHRLSWDHESDGSDERSLPCEHFDLIGGSGTGGLIAILFAKLRMSVEEASEELWNVIEHVYNPGILSGPQRTEALKRCMEGAMKRKGLPIDLRLTTNKPEGCAGFVVASPRIDATSTICLRTYPVRRQPTSSITVVEAVLATCATQPDFAPVTFGSGHRAREYVAVSGAANPIYEVIAEAHLLFGGDASVVSLLSLGTGHPGILRHPQDGDEVAVALHKFMWDTMYHCEQRAQEIEERIGRVGIYSRFSVNQGMQNNHVGQFDDPSWITAQTEVYLGRHESGERLDRLARNCGLVKGPITLDQLKHAGGPNYPGHVVTIVQKSLEILISNQDDDIIAKLKPKDLECESKVETCLEGTRRDILYNIRTWAADLEAPNILWLNGYPGVGKSAIASTIVEELHASNRFGSSFFFQRERASAMTPNALWCNVAYDLARRYPSIRKHIVNALIANESLPTTLNIDALFRELISEPLTKSDDIPIDKLPVIVLDALDECGGIDGWRSDHRKKLMRTLKSWSSLSRRFKLVVTSRWEDDIERLFSTTGHHPVEVISGERIDSVSSADIRTFLLHELRQLLDRYPSLPSGWPGEKETVRLINGANGIFIWIKTVIKLLESGEPQRTLRQILSNGAGSMAELYTWILHASFPKPNIDDAKDFQAVLGAIIFIKEPLDVVSLAHFLSIDGSTIDYICNGLRSVLDCGRILRIRHQSFVDFLLDSTDCPLSFLIDKERESRNLALCCLSTMKRYLRFNICDLESSYVRNQDVPNLTQQVDKCILPYLSYSSCYWASHLAETSSDNEVHDSVTYFMDHLFLFWLEVISLIKQMNIGSNMLHSLIDWLRVNQDDSLATDMQKFVAGFASVISQSTPHIYISALPFAPRCLGVSKQYLNGKRIVSGSWDKTIRVWDAETGQTILGPLQGHRDEVKSVSFSPDGKRIVSGSKDQTIRVWDAVTGQTVLDPLQGHSHWVLSVSFSPDGKRIVSGSWDKTIRVWDAETGQPVLGPLEGHSLWVNSVLFSSDGKQIVSSSCDKTIRVWDA